MKYYIKEATLKTLKVIIITLMKIQNKVCGEINISHANFNAKNIYFHGITNTGKIHNDEQKANKILNDYQEADNIQNFSQKADIISNSHQVGKTYLINSKQKSEFIENF